MASISLLIEQKMGKMPGARSLRGLFSHANIFDIYFGERREVFKQARLIKIFMFRKSGKGWEIGDTKAEIDSENPLP